MPMKDEEGFVESGRKEGDGLLFFLFTPYKVRCSATMIPLMCAFKSVDLPAKPCLITAVEYIISAKCRIFRAYYLCLSISIDELSFLFGYCHYILSSILLTNP